MTVTEFLSDEEVGVENLERQEQNHKLLEDCLKKVDKLEDFFVMAENSRRPEYKEERKSLTNMY